MALGDSEMNGNSTGNPTGTVLLDIAYFTFCLGTAGLLPPKILRMPELVFGARPCPVRQTVEAPRLSHPFPVTKPHDL